MYKMMLLLSMLLIGNSNACETFLICEELKLEKNWPDATELNIRLTNAGYEDFALESNLITLLAKKEIYPDTTAAIIINEVNEYNGKIGYLNCLDWSTCKQTVNPTLVTMSLVMDCQWTTGRKNN
jgi:hypothetical protein